MRKFGVTRRQFTSLALAASVAGGGSAHAQSKGKVVAVTWGGGVGRTWREAFAKPFQARSGIPVTIGEAPDPTAQVRAQAASPQYNVFSATYADAVNLYHDGLVETLDVATIPGVEGTQPKYRLAAPDGRLLGIPLYFTYYGIAVNTDIVKPGDITSWKDLAHPRWKGRIAHARPVYASIYDLTACAYAEGGDERKVDPGVELFRKIAANALTAFSSLAQANQLLSRGEVAAAPFFASRVWAMKADGLPVDMIIPKEGALMLPYMGMIPKATFDQDAAKAFLSSALEPTPQSEITELAGYHSLVTSAKLSPEHEKRVGMPLDQLKARLIQPDWFVLAEQHEKRVNLVEQVIAAAMR